MRALCYDKETNVKGIYGFMSEPLWENPSEAQPELQIQSAPEPSMPMAWHAAQKRILIWLEAALHLGQAAMILSGGIYRASGVRKAVYAGMPAMAAVDGILAAALIAAAILLIAARKPLAARRKAGIKRLRAAYILLPAAWLFYGAARYFIAGLSPFSTAVAGQCIGYAALLWVNCSYYQKRSALFSDAAAA